MFEVKYTTRFKKDYKLLKKRGYDMNKLLDVLTFCVRDANCHHNIKTILFTVTMRDIATATLNRTGFSSTTRTKTLSSFR